MRPSRLLLALGNPLMGDDGVGWHVTERLRADPELPADVEIAWGGTDLLAAADLLTGRERIVLVDAIEAFEVGDEPGRVVELDPEDEDLDPRSTGAHALSVPGALALLRRTTGGLAGTDVRLLGVTVGDVRAGESLSPELARRLPAIAGRLLAAAAGDGQDFGARDVRIVA